MTGYRIQRTHNNPYHAEVSLAGPANFVLVCTGETIQHGGSWAGNIPMVKIKNRSLLSIHVDGLVRNGPVTGWEVQPGMELQVPVHMATTFELARGPLFPKRQRYVTIQFIHPRNALSM